MKFRITLKVVALALTLSACELDEITLPQAQPVVVVHSVINVEQPIQFVILEWSLVGRTSEHYSTGLVPPAPAGEGIPIEGATVALTYHGAGTCATPTVQLFERPPVDMGELGIVPSGTYTTNELCSLAPGDSVGLRIETREGNVVLGTTVIPGARSIDVHTRSEWDVNLAVDRGVDSVWIDVDPISARALAIELSRDRFRNPYEYPSGRITQATDTMSIVFAGNLMSEVFEDEDDREAVFTPGQYLTLTVGVADTNYYDFVRSFSNPLTGRGFINHLQGGIGVFGSVVTSDRYLRVTDRQEDAREGLYRISGTVDSVEVDAVIDVYLQPFGQDGEFSAFVDGTWAMGPLSTSADGQYQYTSAAARFGTGNFYARFLTASENTRVWYDIAGSPSRTGVSFPALAISTIEIAPYYYRHVTDTVMVERIAGSPGPG